VRRGCEVPGCRRLGPAAVEDREAGPRRCEFHRPKGRRKGSCGGTSPLPEGKQWAAHQGRRERERRVRQAERLAEAAWGRFEKVIAQDPGGRDFEERLLAFASELPERRGALFCYAVAAGALAPGRVPGEVLAAAEGLLKTAMEVPRVDSSWFKVEV